MGQNLILNGGCENPGVGNSNDPDSWSGQVQVTCGLEGVFGALVSEGSYSFVENRSTVGDDNLIQIIDLTTDESGSVFDFSIDYNTLDIHQFRVLIEAVSASDIELGVIHNSGDITVCNIWQTHSASTTAAPNGTEKLRVTLIWVGQNALHDAILDNASLVKNETLSINEFDNANKIKLFPNPTNGFIQISDLVKQTNYKIYNALGAEIKKGIVDNDEQIDIRNFANGLYLLKLDNGNTIKFLKE